MHHYLFDVEFAPPGRTPVRIQKTIRERFVNALGTGAVTHPHIVVSHSMGTVIGYDCIKRVGGCAKVDGFIEDIAVQNEGAWRHSITKYLRQPSFVAALRRMLQLP